MSAADPSGHVGRVLNGTYRIVSPLARGGMGAIYTAEHARLAGKRYAIKMLHRAVASSDETFQRFQREAEIASHLGHEHIVEVHDFDVTPEGDPYMVMEFLAGEDLAARIARGPLPLGNVVGIVQQLASALGAAHAAGIVHRDLKPQNVFLIERGGRTDFVKVLDFGISKVRDSHSLVTRDQAVMGTPFYMSPEQALGQARDVDGRTDVFALGAIVWEMLTGEIAFASDTIPGALYKVVHVQPRPVHELRAELPPEVNVVLARAMAKDRAARTASVHQVAAELAHVVEGRATPWPIASVEATPASAPVRTTPTTMSSSIGQVAATTWTAPQRRRVFAGIAIGAVVVAMVALFAWRARRGSEPPSQPASAAPARAPAPAPAPRPAPAPALKLTVVLRFDVRPHGVPATVWIDGAPLQGVQEVRLRDSAPVHVIATAADHETWEADVMPDRDRDVAIELIPRTRPKPAHRPRDAPSRAAPLPPVARPELPTAPPPPPVTSPEPVPRQLPPAPASPPPTPKKKSGTIFDQ